MIALTPAAANEIKRMQSSRQQLDSYFRIGIRQGGCSGWYYTLDLTQQVQENDLAYESQGISILIDRESDMYLQDLQLDYTEDLMGGGFRFDNPQGAQTCSCGFSLALKNNQE